jgi:hypothetical protein
LEEVEEVEEIKEAEEQKILASRARIASDSD